MQSKYGRSYINRYFIDLIIRGTAINSTYLDEYWFFDRVADNKLIFVKWYNFYPFECCAALEQAEGSGHSHILEDCIINFVGHLRRIRYFPLVGADLRKVV
jgi:hypothetical protein